MEIAKKTIIVLLLSSATIGAEADQSAKIDSYRAMFISCLSHDKHFIAIRAYRLDNIPHFLLVDPNTYEIHLAKSSDIKCHRSLVATDLDKTPYGQAMSQNFEPMVNAGFTKSICPIKGMALTIDMCPSHKPIDKKFFVTLANLPGKHPLPVAIAMTGTWMLSHPKDFAWLVRFAKQEKLAITWMNHSFSHRYEKGTPLKLNFMMLDPDHFEQEVLKTEELLLEKHQIPSVFFRFPGLIANKTLMRKLNKLGLIPLGSSAWLAKDEKATDGSIVLVHGNGNEPKGIRLINRLLKAKTIWLPLAQMLTGMCKPLP